MPESKQKKTLKRHSSRSEHIMSLSQRDDQLSVEDMDKMPTLNAEITQDESKHDWADSNKT